MENQQNSDIDLQDTWHEKHQGELEIWWETNKFLYGR